MKVKNKLLLLLLMLTVSVVGCKKADKNETETVGQEQQELQEQEKKDSNLEVEVPKALNREEVIEPLLSEAETLATGYFYEEALECLSDVPEEFSKDDEVMAAIEKYTAAKDSFVPYDQPVRHIFFHPLIVDTSLAFDGDSTANGYNYWMTTIHEFNAILEELYARNYILIDIHELCEETTDENGNTKLVAKQPMVPEGKIPIIISEDNISYNYKEDDGLAKKLLLDENGDVKNLYVDQNGEESIGDYDVAPIVDSFVKEHPDFSLRGAKGILAVTGFDGLIGYKIHDPENPNMEEDKETIRAVAKRLKETGWLFASHSYAHKHEADMSYQDLVSDSERWKEEVGSLVGETDIYVYPYGEEVDYPSDKLTYLQNEGFVYLLGVWTKPFVSVQDHYVRQTRCNLDGYTLATKTDVVADLVDTKKIIDSSRPPLGEIAY